MIDAPRISVAGVGQTGPTSSDPRSIPEMVLAAVEEALADADLGFDRIDAVVTASVDLYDGLTASSVAVTEVVGAVMKPETRIAGDGLAALVQAFCQLRARAYGTVLVVAHGKASMASPDELGAWTMDPVHLQPLGVTATAISALQAQAAALGRPDAELIWAERAARRGADAARHNGGMAGVATANDVLASPTVASPLRAEMAAPPADAACAAVLVADPKGDSGEGVKVTGVGHDLDAHDPASRDLAEWQGAKRATDRALAVAGLRGAVAFDLLEPSCLFPHEEELFLDALGLDARTPISPSGGLFAGAAPVAAGLTRLVCATRALRESDARRALVHGAWGPAGQAHAVAILETAA